MRTIAQKREGRNKRGKAMQKAVRMDPDKEMRLSMIQALIPLGLMAVGDVLNEELRELVGERYERGKKAGSWGSNKGSIFMADQKFRIKVPRARNKMTNEEIPLPSYARLQNPFVVEESIFSRVLHGISQKDYKKAVLNVPETFGISRNSVSKKFIRVSERRLREFSERSLNGHDVVVVFIDGKRFGNNGIIQALGVTLTGDKVVLGFVESSTESYEACRNFLQGLKDRGLSAEQEILFVIDGAKGIHKAVVNVFGDKALMARCQ